jgi:hypothetical protein
VEQGVVVAAQKAKVVDLRLAVLSPGDLVMDVAPASRPSASGSDAMAIPGDDGSTESRRNDSCLTANIEDLGSGAKDDAGDRGIA